MEREPISIRTIGILYMLVAGISFLRMENETGILCVCISVLLISIKSMMLGMAKKGKREVQEGY